MAVIPRFFLDSIVTLGIKSTNGFYFIGSGFMVFKKTDGELGYSFLITNKHVCDNHNSLYARFNHTDGTFEEIEVTLKDKSGKPLVTLHPNPNIDIAVVGVDMKYLVDRNIVFSSFKLDEHSLTASQMLNEGIEEGTMIYSLGFPMNLVDVIKTPIVRIGCISRIQDLYKDKNRHSYIIDTQVFPGNSGGPVITRPELMSIEGTKSHSKASIIGIVYGYIPYQETLVSLQDQKPRSILQENSGLALVHPVDYIYETIRLNLISRGVKIL